MTHNVSNIMFNIVTCVRTLTFSKRVMAASETFVTASFRPCSTADKRSMSVASSGCGPGSDQDRLQWFQCDLDQLGAKIRCDMRSSAAVSVTVVHPLGILLGDLAKLSQFTELLTR